MATLAEKSPPRFLLFIIYRKQMECRFICFRKNKRSRRKDLISKEKPERVGKGREVKGRVF